MSNSETQGYLFDDSPTLDTDDDQWPESDDARRPLHVPPPWFAVDSRARTTTHVAGPFDELTVWKCLNFRPDLPPDLDAAWLEAARVARARKSTRDPIAMLIDAVPPPLVAPVSLVPGPILGLDPLSALGEGGYSGLARAMEELAAINLAEAERPILVLHVSVLLAGEASPDGGALAVAMISRAQAWTPRVVLVGTPAEWERLKRQRFPLVPIRVAPSLPPHFARPMVSCDPCVGREEEMDIVANLIANGGQHILITGVSGCGKTTFMRALRNHPALRDRAFFEINSSEMMAGTEFRGMLESNVKSLGTFADEQKENAPVYCMDEANQFTQRSSRAEGFATDSAFDLMKGDLTLAKPRYILVMTATEQDRAALSHDPGLARRLHEVRLKELSGKRLERAVAARARSMGVCSSRAQLRQILALAPRLISEASPAAECKAIGWVKATGKSLPDAVREMRGEIAAPRRAALHCALDQFRRDYPGWEEIIRVLGTGMDAALRRLITSDERGPLMTVLVVGQRGSGKRTFVRAFAKALRVTKCVELAADRVRLQQFARDNATVPGGIVMVTGEASVSAPANEESGGQRQPGRGADGGLAISDVVQCLSPLNRWIPVIIMNTATPETGEMQPRMIEEPLPQVFIPMSPVRLGAKQALALGRRLNRELRDRARAQGLSTARQIDLRRVCRVGQSPHEMETIIAAETLGVAPQPDPTRTVHGGSVIPFDRARIIAHGTPDNSGSETR
jgi:energy-coupling factor transporter ATP-binding protein EcfA2